MFKLFIEFFILIYYTVSNPIDLLRKSDLVLFSI